ncbi:three-helix bundle dimerization domain-containing protein [Cryobacterium breve]|uniref:three-helix bundle dimerization domain-containing protein n=1 Tax=Cryobacterium breve TaxID=1259258 RepID=UPI003BB080E5
MLVNLDDELQAVDKIVDRLTERFPNLPRSSVERAVREEHETFSGRPIRDFVPVLVEHGVKERLRKQ